MGTTRQSGGPIAAPAPTLGLILVVFGLTAACGISERGTRCGIAALAGPGLLLEEFTKPGRTLADPPESMPERLVVRMAAGDAWRGLVGRTDSGWVVGVDAAVPANRHPGFAVLMVDPVLGPQGVMLFDGPPIPGAPIIGHVNAGALDVPLIGVRAAPAAFQDARCPLFPDSLKQ